MWCETGPLVPSHERVEDQAGRGGLCPMLQSLQALVLMLGLHLWLVLLLRLLLTAGAAALPGLRMILLRLRHQQWPAAQRAACPTGHGGRRPSRRAD